MISGRILTFTATLIRLNFAYQATRGNLRAAYCVMFASTVLLSVRQHENNVFKASTSNRPNMICAVCHVLLLMLVMQDTRDLSSLE